MGTKVTRKSRGKANAKVDILKPIPLSVFKLGTSDDPCFGKHNDPTHPICRQCGDCEICAAVQAQGLHLLRAAEEKKTSFKDLEEEAIDKLTTRQKFNKMVLAALRDKNPMSLEELKERAEAGLEVKGIRFTKLLDKLINKRTDLTLKKGNLHKAK